MRLLWRFVITAAVVWIGGVLLPGIELKDGVSDLYLAAFVFGFVNAFIPPIAHLFTRQLTFVALALVTLAINGAMVLITAALVESPALAGSTLQQVVAGTLATLVIAGASTAASWFVPD